MTVARRALNVLAMWLAHRLHYRSTYCLHGDHDHCRLWCKACAKPCRCPCHAHETEPEKETTDVP